MTFAFDGGLQKWQANSMTVMQMRQEFEPPHVIVHKPDGSILHASGSDSAALPESVVVLDGSKLVSPVVAPEADACGSASARADLENAVARKVLRRDHCSCSSEARNDLRRKICRRSHIP